jgi:hypothetical protein
MVTMMMIIMMMMMMMVIVMMMMSWIHKFSVFTTIPLHVG